MIPVELHLTNFLSYGTAAPVLEFDHFHVACLSGRNGQGKSALLDAITWALWGEARKSSGGHKPDEELIRIGARRMQVDFAFDIEGERYRVTRGYLRSATGKTSKAELEFSIFEPSEGDYHPLTGASVKETQERLNQLLGIDYDTFINSAFLLQGRSDEFTKKKPSERKDILARILNLGRYERLALLARDHERDAADRVDRADADVSRLKQELEKEPAWKEQHSAVQKSIEEESRKCTLLRAEETRLVECLAVLDLKAREAASLRKSIEDLSARIEQGEVEKQNLQKKIAEAEALIAQKEQIERDYDRWQVLQRERDSLDTKQELFRGVEKQIDARKGELKDLKNEIEMRLHTFEVEINSNQTAWQECEGQLKQESTIRRSLEQALSARKQFEEMNGVLTQRRAWEDEIKKIEHELHGQCEAIQGQLQALLNQIRRDTAVLPPLETLLKQQESARNAVEDLQAMQTELETVRIKGQQAAETLREHSGLLSARQQTLQEQKENRERFLSATDGVCPICKTELGPDHKEEVVAHYDEAISSLRVEIREVQIPIQKWQAERERLLDEFKALEKRITASGKAPEQLSAIEEQLRRREELQAALDVRCAEAQELQRKLDEKLYGQDQRERRLICKQQLDGLSFDEEAFEQVKAKAAQAPRFEEQLRNLEQLAIKKEQHEKTILRLEQQRAALRKQVDDGTLFGPLYAQIGKLEGQLAKIGFDPSRLVTVRKLLNELEGVGERVTNLLHAQQNRESWLTQAGRIQVEADRSHTDLEAQRSSLAEAETELSRRSLLEEDQKTQAAACRDTESRLKQLQILSGQLAAQLEQAKQNHEQLKLRRKEHTEARTQRALYKQLRAAFGKHGIPSLIIEQTLPEIEDRANELLDRLADGRMHVRLETLKDKKTGGTKETLEIIITDEQGSARAYETFSGGEAFRVNFALRIALAQLLAERSGVRIRTLVIDEGFGTQDSQGVQSLVEAIQSIQQDFDKIIVITHLDQLKNVFPVRIEVEKDPVEGSRFEMIGV